MSHMLHMWLFVQLVLYDTVMWRGAEFLGRGTHCDVFIVVVIAAIFIREVRGTFVLVGL